MTVGRTLRLAAVVALLSVAVPAAAYAERVSLTFYGGLFGNKEYVQGWEGIAASVGVHERVALLGRITGVHIIEADRFREGHSGIGEGGLGFTLAPNTTLAVLGGTYFGEIEDPIIDGQFSTAQLIADRWFYLSVGGLYGFESNRWQNNIYLSTPITDPQEDVILFAGVESILYNEGRFREGDDFVRNPDHDDVRVQVGPTLSIYKRSWDAGVRFGAGGGDFGPYGSMALWKTVSF